MGIMGVESDCIMLLYKQRMNAASFSQKETAGRVDIRFGVSPEHEVAASTRAPNVLMIPDYRGLSLAASTLVRSPTIMSNSSSRPGSDRLAVD